MNLSEMQSSPLHFPASVAGNMTRALPAGLPHCQMGPGDATKMASGETTAGEAARVAEASHFRD